MDHVYKNQLQSYALKQNMDLPVYAAERQGPAHAPRFRCKVTVCGQTFQGEEFLMTLKAAEHAAAKIAMASLTPLNPEGIDVAYKNLLQEIAQKESSLLPVYATATFGPSHAPSFISTVEFAGKVFRGEEAKTKKLAEMSAAKVAFMSIRHGHPNQTSSPSLPCETERQEAANLNVKRSIQEIPSQPSKMVTPDVPSKLIEVYEDEFPDVLNASANSVKEINIAALPVATHPTNDGHPNQTSSPSLPCETERQEAANLNVKRSIQEIPSQPSKMVTPDVPSKWIEVYEDEFPDVLNASANSVKEINIAALPVATHPTNDGNLSAPPTNAMEVNIAAAASSAMPQNPTNHGNESSSSCVEDSERKLIMGTGHLSIPTGQHVVCRPWNPEMTLPQDAEMLFRDDRFIAYRLVNP